MEHGCLPYGNAKARAVAWNLPDPVPVHREPIYTSRTDLIPTPDQAAVLAADPNALAPRGTYPTLRDRRGFRMPHLGLSVQMRSHQVARDFPIILTSGRLVEYEGGGEETRSNPWLAELQQDMFIELNPADATSRGIRAGQWVWVLGAENQARIRVKALLTERVGRGVAFMPFHFGGWWQGEDRRGFYPPGTDPIVLGESANTVTTYGYDPVTMMQETKVTLLPDPRGVGGATHGPLEVPLRRDRCIECNACVTACKNEHEVPWGINRRRVVTINDGKPGERSISMACMHCTDAPCAAVCPVACFYGTADGLVLHDKDLCIGCGYCFYACPFGAPQYPRIGNFGGRGKMDKCTYCAGGPQQDGSNAEYAQYGTNRIAEGKLPLCAEMCSTKALLAGDQAIIADIYRERVARRGFGSGAWGWRTAYRATTEAT
jgi:Fe-S-cluster-containing dehydrogenase component